MSLLTLSAVAGSASAFVHSAPSLRRCVTADAAGCQRWTESATALGAPGRAQQTPPEGAQAEAGAALAGRAVAAVAMAGVATALASCGIRRRLSRRATQKACAFVLRCAGGRDSKLPRKGATMEVPKVVAPGGGKDGGDNDGKDDDEEAGSSADATAKALQKVGDEVTGGGAFAERRKEDMKPPKNAWDVLSRYASASWESFVDTATAKNGGKKKSGFNYNKGIEGMSMGSLFYEMLNTPESSEDFKGLKKEYEEGWGIPYINLSARKTSAALQGASRALGLDGVWLVMVNLLQTVGVPGELIDGIPVQNKWMTIVRDTMSSVGKQEAGVASEQTNAFVNNLVMGRMERIAGEPMPIFLEAYGEKEGIFKIVIGPRSVVVVSDPVIIKHVLQGQENYTKGILTEVLEPIMGKGLIPADLATSKVRRKALVPGFHKQWLKKTTALIHECSDRLCEDLATLVQREGGTARGVTVNMEEKFTSTSLDIIGKAVFDYDFKSVERESPIVRAVYSVLREAERRAQSVVPYWNLPGAASMFKDQKEHEANLTLLNAVLDELLRNAMEEKDDLGNQEDGHLSLLQYLVVTKNEDVSTKQLRDDLMTLLIAGHETTAALLTWALHELMKPKNKETLLKVRDEIDSVCGDRNFEFEDMQKLPLLKAVLLETLRLYPEPPLLIRRCENGDDAVPVGPCCEGVVGDTISMLPGQDIFISTWSLQRSSLLWGENSNDFDPFRWDRPIPGKGKWAGYRPEKAGMYQNETATDFAFLPFGGGPRKCIGDMFALLEAEVCLVDILKRFDFTAAASTEGQKMGMTTGATIHTTGGLLMDVMERKRPSRAVPGEAGELAEAPVPVVPLTLPRFMERNSKNTVAQRIEPEAMVVPTAKELRRLFTEEAMSLKKEPKDPKAIESAYTKCKEITSEYSKTFFLGSQLLDEEEQRAVWAIYNWCRSTDELVDGPQAATTTMADLEAWEERLQATFEKSKLALDGSVGWEDLSMADSVRRFSLIQRPFQDMIGGMAMDLVKTRYETFHELEVYCYRVAGTVGVMTLPVLGFDGMQNFTQELQEQTIAAAMSLGLAFQLTNILRDVGEDARRGRIYVPLEDLRRFDISEEEVLAAANTEGLLYTEQKWKDFMEFQFERCERFYDVAKNGIIGLSEVNRLGVMAALFVYGAILEAVRRNNYDNFSKRAYVDLSEKMVLMGQAWWRVQELQREAEENVKSGRIFTRSKQLEKQSRG